MEKVTTVGIDLAKNVFSLHGVDASGKVVVKRTVCRAELVRAVAALPPCVIGMEACSGSHAWARAFEGFGHTVRLMAPAFVVPPNRVQWVRRDALAAAEALPALARAAIADLRAHLTSLEERVGAYDRALQTQAQASEAAQRLMQIRGVGPLTAMAIVATVGNARDFSSGRQFAAWLGLTPRQHSTGGKPRLGHITRRGDAYIRMLLVQGARSVLHTAQPHTDRLSRWALSVQSRRGYHKALVAIAAKNARIAWALLSKQQNLRAA